MKLYFSFSSPFHLRPSTMSRVLEVRLMKCSPRVNKCRAETRLGLRSFCRQFPPFPCLRHKKGTCVNNAASWNLNPATWNLLWNDILSRTLQHTVFRKCSTYQSSESNGDIRGEARCTVLQRQQFLDWWGLSWRKLFLWWWGSNRSYELLIMSILSLIPRGKCSYC